MNKKHCPIVQTQEKDNHNSLDYIYITFDIDIIFKFFTILYFFFFCLRISLHFMPRHFLNPCIQELFFVMSQSHFPLFFIPPFFIASFSLPSLLKKRVKSDILIPQTKGDKFLEHHHPTWSISLIRFCDCLFERLSP